MPTSYVGGVPHEITPEQYAAARAGRPLASNPSRRPTPAPAATATPPKQPTIAAVSPAARRETALKRVAKTGGSEAAEAKRILASEGATEASEQRAAAVAALPKSITEAKGDARTFSHADMRRQMAARAGARPASAGRATMEKELRKMGLEPVR